MGSKTAIYFICFLVLASYTITMPLPPGFFCGKFTPTPSLHNKLLASGPSGDLLISQSNSVSLFSASLNKVTAEIKRPHDDPLSNVFAIPNKNGSQIITSSIEGDAKVWDLGPATERKSDPELLRASKLFQGPIVNMIYHEPLDVIIALGDDGTLKVWNYNNGTVLSTIEKEEFNRPVAMEIVKHNNNTYIVIGGEVNIKVTELSGAYELVEERKIVPPIAGAYDILIPISNSDGYFVTGAQMRNSFLVYNIGTKGDNPLDTRMLPSNENVLGIKYMAEARALGVASKNAKSNKKQETLRIYRVEDKKTNLNTYQIGAFTDFKDLNGSVLASGQMVVSESAKKIYLLVANGLKEYKITNEPVMTTTSGECYYPCPFGSNPTGDNCVKCHNSCLTCSGPGANECFFCKTGLFYFNSFCFESCPKGAATHHGNKTCSCIPKYTYNAEGFCEKKNLRPTSTEQKSKIKESTAQAKGEVVPQVNYGLSIFENNSSENELDTSYILKIVLPVGGAIVFLALCLVFIVKKRSNQSAKPRATTEDDPSYQSPKNFKKFEDEQFYSTKNENESKPEKKETEPKDILADETKNGEDANPKPESKEESKEESNEEEGNEVEPDPVTVRHTKTTQEEDANIKAVKDALNRSEPNLKPFIDRQPIYIKRQQKNQTKDKKRRKLSDSNINPEEKKKATLNENPTLANIAASKKII